MSKGIYKITNTINNKCYIGKSSDIEERWKYHKKRYNNIKEYDKPLYRAFRKYGINNFLFEIIELINDDYKKLSNEREKYWIVIYLRKRYVECKYTASYIWENEFKDKISKRGFQAIWLGDNAKNIMPEIFTQENKEKQIKLSRAYEGVLRRRIKLEEKKKVQEKILKGEKIKDIWYNEYKEMYKSLTGFRDMIKAISLDEEVNLNGKLDKLES